LASDEEKKQQGDGKGFAGLSSMLSDVDATISGKPKLQQREAPSSSTQQSSQAARQERQEPPRPSQQTYQPPAQPSGGSTAGKWWLGIAVIIGAIWIANQSDNKTPSSTAYSPGGSPTPTVPVRPNEQKPEVGRNNVLSTGQIRYCLAEKIRLDAAEAVINNYVDSDVDRFNGYVDDYNSRCGEFRYRQGALESARREVEPHRVQLQADGRSRFSRTSAVTTQSSATAQTPQAVGPSPDARVLAIQRRLNELGYDAGEADGLMGNKTRSAIRWFQANNGLTVDGTISASLFSLIESPLALDSSMNMDISKKETSSPQTNNEERPNDSGPQPANQIPQNAELDYTGRNWTCQRGYRQIGNDCVLVGIPQNAELDYTGRDWTCQRGYRQVSNDCVLVGIPQNAELDYTGRDWTCQRGYRQVGNDCVSVDIPQNAELDYTGRDWTCQRGYRQVSNDCVSVDIPQNAELDYTGRDWTCQRGYRQVGNDCVLVGIPQNAELDYTGRDWTCQRGYRQVSNDCVLVGIPQNAELDYTGRNWTCKSGYRESGNGCEAL